ncbi:MAG TPA: cytochrome P450 [Acidimicrobiales bacterium]|nr:cytochrome P450 [Acidimicrobiales bacterium]
MPETPSTTRQIDLLDGDWYANGPYTDYAWMRANAPLYWDGINELWGVSRYADIVEIEKRKDLFINSDQNKGGYRPNIPADPAIIGLDDPVHHKRRNLVSRRFTPKAVAAWEPVIRSKVNALLDAVAAKGGTAEIIGDLAAPLPAMMIGLLLGFEEERWPDLQRWSESTIALGGGPRYMDEAGVAAATEFFMTAVELHGEKSRCPADDVMTVWTKAVIDGEPLDPFTVAADCLLLLDGGAETTRTVIARTLLNLIRYPEQWNGLRSGADIPTAVEEMIRFVTPIHNMCRVAVEDTEVAGGKVAAGQQLVLMYGSANRDESVFDQPETFDIGRSPNNHIAFGFGTHFCLGAALARTEIRIFFEELVRRVSSFRLVPGTEPVEMPNAFVYGLRSAEVEFQFGE